MEKGIILKGVGGIYEVQTDSGILLCSLRGRMRLDDNRVLVGDRVEVSREGDRGVVERILPRSSELTRPAIANVDQVVVIFAVQNPRPDFLLLDRILVHAELSGLASIVVFNKADLDLEKGRELEDLYATIPYPTLLTSVKESMGLEQLSQLFKGKISSLVGPSGVGKSSLLNALDSSLSLETQAVSTRGGQRGKHTTRTVHLLPVHNGYVADTPGFSQLVLGSDLEAELQYAFPEMEEYISACQFRGCLHRHEPSCGVKAALQKGKILPQRYKNYLTLLEEVVPHRY